MITTSPISGYIANELWILIKSVYDILSNLATKLSIHEKKMQSPSCTGVTDTVKEGCQPIDKRYMYTDNSEPAGC